MPDLTLPFSCAVVPNRNEVRVCPRGELDISTVGDVDARLAELRLTGFDEIVLDLSGLTFLDSTGVHLVIRWNGVAADEGFRFTVITANKIVDSVFELTGVREQVLERAA